MNHTIDTKHRFRPRIETEWGHLDAVLVHRPGREILRVLPDNMRLMLFDDIPYLSAMQREHDDFTRILRDDCGVTVLYLNELLLEAVHDGGARGDLIAEVTRRANCDGLNEYLSSRSDAQLVDCLIQGVRAMDWKRELDERTDWLSHNGFYGNNAYPLQGLPNLYFTRDPGAIVRSGYIKSRMHFEARDREATLLYNALHHSGRVSFQDGVLFGVLPGEDRPLTVEGGDIIVLNEKAVAIGCSERTRRDTIRHLATTMFRRGLLERVYEVEIPVARKYMHLDTVFTIIDRDLVVVFPDALNELSNTRLYVPRALEGEIVAFPTDLGLSFLDVLENEVGGFELVLTGAGEPDAARREQWSDGTNVLAVGRREVVCYDRNEATVAALRSKGVKVHVLRGSELVRGRGGPRCMSLPLIRRVE